MNAILELSADEIDALLREQTVGRIGCHAGGLTYVVPVIYAYDGESVHVLSVEGQKLRMMRANPEVCFEVDEYDGRGSWRSVVAQGRFEELEGDEAERTLAVLVERFAGRDDRTAERAPRAEGQRPVAFRIRLLETTGRRVPGRRSRRRRLP